MFYLPYYDFFLFFCQCTTQKKVWGVTLPCGTVVHVRDLLALNPIRLGDDIREFEMPIIRGYLVRCARGE